MAYKLHILILYTLRASNNLIISRLENTLFWSTKIPYIAIPKHPVLHDQYRVFCFRVSQHLVFDAYLT